MLPFCLILKKVRQIEFKDSPFSRKASMPLELGTKGRMLNGGCFCERVLVRVVCPFGIGLCSKKLDC